MYFQYLQITFSPKFLTQPQVEQTRLATVPISVASRVLADLRPLQVEKFGKTWKKSPWFGRDHVARSSSGLKPLRRRTPRHLNTRHQGISKQGIQASHPGISSRHLKTRHPGIQKQINVRYRKKYHKCKYALSHCGKQIAETCQGSG